MNVLCLIPPYIPSYFNAGHHLICFQIASHLRRKYPDIAVKAVDACAMRYSWRDFIRLVSEPFDLVILVNDFDAIDSFERTIYYTRKLLPTTLVITTGRLSSLKPEIFKKFDLDGIHCQGDPEIGAENFVASLRQGTLPEDFLIRNKERVFVRTKVSNRSLRGEELVLPDIEEIPYRQIQQFYAFDLNKFCGIPEKLELVVPMARGCPIACSFCDVPLIQGKLERRVPVPKVMSYLESAFRSQFFDYFSFYAPTWNLDRAWVFDFCRTYHSSGLGKPWKCTAVLNLLTEEMIREMARAGCIRISLGIESTDEFAMRSLPRSKRANQSHLELVIEWCNSLGIELNCFLVYGLSPNDLPSLQELTQYLVEKGVRVRPTILADYLQIDETMSVFDISTFNRQLFRKHEAGEQDYYKYLYSNKTDKPTRIHETF